MLRTHREGAALLEGEAAGGDEILGGKPGSRKPRPFEGELLLCIHVEDAVHQLQTGFAIQRFRSDAQLFQVVEDVQLNPVQTRLGSLDVLCIDAEGNVLGLGQTIVALGKLILQHLRILPADAVEAIRLLGNADAFLKGIFTSDHVVEGELEADAAVEVVQAVTPALKDRRLVFVLGQLVVDVLELNGLSEIGVGDAADAIRPHPLIRDRILRGARLLGIPLDSGRKLRQLLALSPRQPGALRLGVTGVSGSGVSRQ